MFFRLAKELIDGLRPAKNGPRVSERWNTFWIRPDLGKFPLRLRVLKEAGAVTPDMVWRPLLHHHKAGSDGQGGITAMDHLEIRLYPRSAEQLANEGIDRIHVLNFAHCDKDEDVEFSPWPEKIIRLDGTLCRGILYASDPRLETRVSTVSISKRTVEAFPVRVTAVGAEPVKSSTAFPKFEVMNDGVEGLYDRRNVPAGFARLELVETVKGERSWRYFNLLDLSQEQETETTTNCAVLDAENGKLIVKKNGKSVDFSQPQSQLGKLLAEELAAQNE